MAYNVEIDANFMPVREMDEQFVMRRDGVEHHVHVRGLGEFKGKGHLILTTRRLVIVNRDFSLFPEFRSFSLPLRETHEERFEEGMMGRFHIDAKCRPHMGMIPNAAHFKLWFDMGGALVFQHYYKRCLIRAKEGLGADAMLMEFRAAEFQNELMAFGDMGGETTILIDNGGQVDVVQQQPMMQQQPMVQQQMMQQDNQMLAGAIGMQLDVALDGELVPIKEGDEEFVMRRNGIEFHVHVNREGEYRGEGHLLLTTKRLILVNRGMTIFKSFSMPLVHIHEENFEMGDLGKFHVRGKCKPGMLNIKHPAEFNIKFNQLGAIHFQRVLERCLFMARAQRDAQFMMMDLRGPEFQGTFMGLGDMGGETVIWIQPNGQVDVVQTQPVMMAPVQEAVAVQRMENAAMVDALMLDAPLDMEFMPVKDMNEEFILRRNFIEFHIHVRDRGDFRGKGHLVLTTKRLVLVNRENTMFKSWSLPLLHTFNEQFEEGMRFHINAHCRHEGALGINHPAHFKVWFNQGGAARFAIIYRKALIRARERVEFGAMMAEFRGPFLVEVNALPMQQEETIFFIDSQPVAMQAQIAPVQKPVEVVVQPQVAMAPVATAVAATECVMLRDCLLGPDGMPIKEVDEEFVMRRNGVEFNIHIKGVGHLKAHGHAVLTTKRLVLVNREPSVFKSFQFPLLHTHREEFKAGMRGRFHCMAHCKPLRSAFGHPAEIKIWFNEGGAIYFQEIYKRLLIRAKEMRDAAAIMLELRGPQFQAEMNGFGAMGNETVLFISGNGQQQVAVVEVQQQAPVAAVVASKMAQRQMRRAAANQVAEQMAPAQKGCCTIF